MTARAEPAASLEPSDAVQRTYCGRIQKLKEMKSTSLFFLCVIFSMSGSCTGPSIKSAVSNPSPSPTVGVEVQTKCFTQDYLSEALKSLSLGDQEQIDQTKQLLLNDAKRSTNCRAEIITALKNGMDKPNLDLQSDEGTYNLWVHGAELLGNLKALEAIDLLISHLDSTNGTFSTSMRHQPALRGLIKMGPIAIPKLEAVLKSNPDPNMRFSAVFCVATIGGPSAVRSLKEALATESDQCVSRFIRVSLDSFDEEGQIRDRGKWFPGGLCDE
jgi:hypothetical protein